MKFHVLALDYDGTIALNGVLDPAVKAAIIEARARGILVVVVTGRILSDLKKVAGDVSFFDAIVAENGAVLSLPAKPVQLLGPPPSNALIKELHRRQIGFTTGECIVDMDVSLAPTMAALIRECELPLSLIANRDRLMVLPHGVNKGTGLRACLAILKQSPKNTMGIGDAENDHDLLAACGMGAAAEWGNEALKQRADEIVEGSEPSAVARYIRRKLKLRRSRHSIRSRRHAAAQR
jgi:hydroxymethylpyrimidine pyrophosphatase-like HAD family hydrolase